MKVGIVRAIPIGLLLVAGLFVPKGFCQPTRHQSKIKVLIVDGFSNHDWRRSTALLRGILEPSGLFEVAVSTVPPTANSPGWAMAAEIR